jgi:hypothetical protein
MATKQKHGPKHVAVGPLDQARRLLEKGDFRQALKEAKVAYRQRPAPEARQLLERAYLARGRQLLRASLRMESRAVVQALLDLGVTEVAVQQELPELLVALGLFERTPSATKGGAALAEGDPLYVAAADHAVLRPEGAPASLPAIRQGGAAVRQALAALEAGDEAQAAALLKDVPRPSPFADWKYFVRGLAAYYREDAAVMQANWERLDPGRFAARIAAPLRALANPKPAAAADSATAQRLVRLGKDVAGGPLPERLQRLQELVAEDRWAEVIRSLRVSAPLFSQADPALLQRIGLALYATLARKGNPACLRELAAVAGAPRIDPNCNRGLAMAWEHSEEGDPEAIEGCWRAYLRDLPGLECLSTAERLLAQALVCLRLGRMLLEESRPICPECGVCHEPDESLLDRAVGCFENSVKLAPRLLKAHQALAEACVARGKPAQAASACRRLLEHFPEDLDTLLFLGDHHLGRDEPQAARDFLLRAQRLKPLDLRIKAKVRALHLALARHHGLAGCWQEGRAELAAAEQIAGPLAREHLGLVRRAVLELKAGQCDLAWRLLEQAKREVGGPAPVWLLATIEGTRYNLPEPVLVGFEDRWAAARKKNRSSPAAGEMCRILKGYLEARLEYPGRKSHLAWLLDYLRRCSRIRWQAADLRSVLGLLMSLELLGPRRVEESPGHADPGEAAKLLGKYAAKARSKFPDVALFQLLAGEMEIRKGPRWCNRRVARECFQRAEQLAQRPGDPDGAPLAKQAKEKLLFLDEVRPPRFRPRFRLPWLPAGGEAAGRPAARGEQGGKGGNAMGFLDEGDEQFLPGGPSAGALFETFATACRELGLNPEELFDEIDGKGPFRFRPGDGSKTRKNRR